MSSIGLPDHLADVVRQLAAAYPQGTLPADDHLPLLAALHEDLREENLSRVVAEPTGSDPNVIAHAGGGSRLQSSTAAGVLRPLSAGRRVLALSEPLASR